MMRRFPLLALVLCLFVAGVSAQGEPAPDIEFVARFGRGYTEMAAWSPDGSRLAVAASIGAWVYDAADWDAAPTLFATDFLATWVEFSPAGGLLAIGLADGTAQAFDIATGQHLDRIIGGPIPERGAMAQHNVPARHAAFVPASIGADRTSFGAVSEQTLTDADGTSLRLRVLLAAPDGETLPEPELVSSDGALGAIVVRTRITIIDITTGAPLHELTGYSDPALEVGFSARADALVVEQIGGTVRAYDVATGADLGTVPTAWPSINALIHAVEPISQRTAVANRPSGILVIDPVHGASNLPGRESLLTSLAFEPGGERLAAGFADGTLRIYDSLTGKDTRDAYAHFGHVTAIVWLPESGYLVTGGEDGRLKLWMPNAAGQLESHAFGVHANEVTGLAVSPDDPSLFASASIDGTVKLWRVGSGD